MVSGGLSDLRGRFGELRRRRLHPPAHPSDRRTAYRRKYLQSQLIAFIEAHDGFLFQGTNGFRLEVRPYPRNDTVPVPTGQS